MGVKILFVGDMHLGRLPARLPDSLAGDSVDRRRLGPAGAWARTVDLALQQEVAAVVLAGDVVESANARFEALGLLERGVRQLTAAGIEVLAIAGNHDVDILPGLADMIEGFHLLGPAGTWSGHTISSAGPPAVHIVGWSFPRQVVRHSPLATGFPPLPTDCPTLGILHCDLLDSASPYAPVRRSELEDTGLDGWFLGHIHKPSLDATDGEPGYLGSLVGLDPTETGRHGPWLVSVTPGQITRQQVPVAPLRWEELEVPVADLEEPDQDLFPRLRESLLELQRSLGDELAETRVVGCRIRLTGRTPEHRQLAGAVARLESEPIEVTRQDTALFIEKIVDASLPALDLPLLARGNDPAALLAATLLALEDTAAPDTEQVAAARNELARIADFRNFAPLGLPPLTDQEVRQLLQRAGYRALEELLATRGETA